MFLQHETIITNGLTVGLDEGLGVGSFVGLEEGLVDGEDVGLFVGCKYDKYEYMFLFFCVSSSTALNIHLSNCHLPNAKDRSRGALLDFW